MWSWPCAHRSLADPERTVAGPQDLKKARRISTSRPGPPPRMTFAAVLPPPHARFRAVAASALRQRRAARHQRRAAAADPRRRRVGDPHDRQSGARGHPPIPCAVRVATSAAFVRSVCTVRTSPRVARASPRVMRGYWCCSRRCGSGHLLLLAHISRHAPWRQGGHEGKKATGSLRYSCFRTEHASTRVGGSTMAVGS